MSRDEEERPGRVIASRNFVNLALSNVVMTGGSFTIDDQLKGLTHEITAINFALPLISDDPNLVDELVTPQFSAVINGTLFDFTGESKPFADNHETGMKLTCKDMDLTVLNPYLFESGPFILKKGKFDFSVGVTSLYMVDEKRLDLLLHGDLRLHDVIIEDQQNTQIAALSSLDVSIKSLDFFKRKIQLDHIALQQPELHLERQKNGDIKFMSLLSSDKKTTAEPESTPFFIECKNISMAEADLVLDDYVPEQMTTHTLRIEHLAVQQFSTAADQLFDFDINLLMNTSGKLTVHGQAGIAPLQGRFQGELSQFPLKSGQNYIVPQITAVLEDGTVSSTFSGSSQKTKTGFNFQVTADIQVEDLVVLESVGKPEVCGLKSLQTKITAKNNPAILQVKEVRIDNPRAHVELQKNGALNITSLIKKKQAKVSLSSPKTVSSAAEKNTIELGLLTLANGQLFVKDRSVSPFYHIEISEINGSVNSVSTLVDTGGAFEFNALFNHHSPLVMTGQTNPFLPNRFLDINMKFSDIEMSPFSPYSQKFIGRDLTKGKLSLQQQIDVKNRMLDVDTNIYIDQLQLGTYQANDTATNLPVGLAVSLLQDRHGIINFDIPIEGSLDDPDFGIGGAVVSVLVNLVTKAATSPFSLIGGMFSGDGESQFIVFTTGKTNIDEQQHKALIDFSKILYDRPGLKVEIGSQYNTILEKDMLIQSKFMDLLTKEQKKNMNKTAKNPSDPAEIIKDSKQYNDYLLAAYKNAKFKRPRNMIGLLEKQPPAEMERMLKENINITPGEIRLLAMQRGETVAAILRENGPVESKRLFILEPVLTTTETPQVELRLQ